MYLQFLIIRSQMPRRNQHRNRGKSQHKTKRIRCNISCPDKLGAYSLASRRCVFPEMFNVDEIHKQHHDFGKMYKNTRKMLLLRRCSRITSYDRQSAKVKAETIVDEPLNMRPARAWGMLSKYARYCSLDLHFFPNQ